MRVAGGVLESVPPSERSTHATERNTAQPPRSARAPSRAALRAMSYGEAVQALTPSGSPGPDQAASEPRGSAALMSSSSALEVTSVRGFTPKLAADIEDNAVAPLDDVLTRVSQTVVEDTDGLLMHPALATVGDTAGVTFGQGPSRRATFVANYLYENISSVSTKGESVALEGALKGRGFPTERQDNLDSRGMQSALLDPLAHVRPGDEVFLSYVGHGKAEGLLGIEHEWDAPDVLSHGAIAAALAAAADGGAHVRMVETACMSGMGPSALRDQELERVSPTADAHWRSVRQSLETVVNSIAGLDRKLGPALEEAYRVSAELRAYRPGEEQASRERREQQAREAWKRHYDALLARAARFWAGLRPTLISIANEVAGADGRPPVEIPAEAPMRRPEIRGAELKFTYASMLDPIYDLDNRLIGVMGGPRGGGVGR